MNRQSLTPSEVKRRVLELLNLGRYSDESGHFKHKHRNILRNHITYVLQTGQAIQERFEWSTEVYAWRYVIEGIDQDGRNLRIVFEFIEVSPFPDEWIYVVSAYDLNLKD
ncbi:MAG: hypothetical protein AMXMBFR84_26510 [Candidatus Hydrogenedentota bacterium]